MARASLGVVRIQQAAAIPAFSRIARKDLGAGAAIRALHGDQPAVRGIVGKEQKLVLLVDISLRKPTVAHRLTDVADGLLLAALHPVGQPAERDALLLPDECLIALEAPVAPVDRIQLYQAESAYRQKEQAHKNPAPAARALDHIAGQG